MSQKRTVGLDVKVLEDKEVLMHFGDKPAIDRATGTFGPGWHSAGLEPSDSTWTENREITENKTNMTGGQTATSYTAGAVSSTVNIVYGSPVVDYIEWPETATKSGVLYRKHSSKVAAAHVARVHKFASNILGIKVSREKAKLTIPERSTSTDPAPRTLTIAYENGEDEYMFEEMYYHITDEGVVTEVEPKIFQDIDDLQAKVAAGEAFVPQGSAAGLKAYVVVEDSDKKDGVTLLELNNPDGATPSPSPSPIPGQVGASFSLSGATGGTYTITVGANTTEALQYDADADAVQSALRAAGETAATVAGTTDSGFQLANLTVKPTVDGSQLTGGSFPGDVTVS